MKRKIYIFLLLVGLPFLLTACTKGKNPEELVRKTKTEEAQEKDGENIKGSLFDLIKLGKNIKCTFEYEDENSTSKGETYVSGEKARSDFTASYRGGENIDSHTITDGEWMYMWSSQSNQGTKISTSEIQSSSQESDDTSGTKVSYSDYRNNFDYKCQAWIPDNSKFVPPSDVKFVEMADILNQFKGGEDGNEDLCKMCNNIGSEEEIKECKQNLGCN